MKRPNLMQFTCLGAPGGAFAREICAFFGMLALLMTAAWPASESEAAGRAATGPDGWVLALSWSPAWCGAVASRRETRQCRRRDLGFVVHGLWPQKRGRSPAYCPGDARLSERQLEAMLDIMPARGLIRHQWRKHGLCAGESAQAYFSRTRRAWQSLVRPAIFRKAYTRRRFFRADIRSAFQAANPHLPAGAFTLVCRRGVLHEIRVCYDGRMQPRACLGSPARRCRSRQVLVMPK